MSAKIKRWGTGYQEGYSSTPVAHEAMYDLEGRRQKADKVLAVLKDHFGAIGDLKALDVGCSTGIMASLYAEALGHVTGIDIDVEAIAHARRMFPFPNLAFEARDGLNTGLPSNSFDVVTCAHVYEHVPNSTALLAEIHRLLRQGGVCFFSATNRIRLIEPHYGRLPLLSLLPRPLAHCYLRLLGRSDHYYEKPLTVWGLRRLTRNFEVIDYTQTIIADPVRYRATAEIEPGSLLQRAALLIIRWAYWLCPTYVWLLRKPVGGD
jgi:2-polyprenyl-3-methyl-5-hydroxy-6-metoxy-1,4-benzoquinol methylase